MDLFLFRHAEAEPASSGVPEDARPLTPAGARRAAQVARGLASAGVRFDRLLHSPIVCAVQSASLLADVLQGESEVTHLLAGPPSPDLLARVDGRKVAMVGHSPWLEELAGLLLGGTTETGSMLSLKKGGWMWLRGDPVAHGMHLRALVSGRLTGRMR
jgi:phosphohistidine phosphatase